ncbi:N-acyl homoserine lactonase family protein [Micromonospora sp. WMMD882]|uniref:N-acyl homoserine lactonase family protein n=1 Tax=Micromonospora sp. WMMD882 TaxID=3015151 RepID=UPI00248A9524|nr:N-acyl homoserine lactonase family protein [Micromonospora sp. WMMD882]WBB78470.1 N-acyl homoserine lactonase family protein [Micromonospora sp. WMMD882]
MTSLHLLDGGVLEVESSVVVPGTGFGRRVAVPVQMFLVGTTSGYVLVDTGNDPGVIDDPVATWGPELAAASRPRVRPHQHPARQLELLGLTPRDVRAVVYTHLHHDHAGGGRVFPGAVHVVQRGELRWARSPDGHAGKAYVPADFAATNWTLAEGDWHMLPGIQLMTTPGHTPGHQSVVLWDVPDLGNVILAGDAINTVGCIDDDLPPGIATDTLAAVQSMRRLTALADATDALVVTGHDPAQFESLPKAPERLRRPVGGPAHRPKAMLDLR